MAGATEVDYPPPGLKGTAPYVFASNGLWLPVAGAAQGDGTAAMLVTGAGAAPAATSLTVANGNGTTTATVTNGQLSTAVANFPATQPVSEAHLPNLDIALTVLRDAITKTGATSKTLADVVSALAATLTVQFPAAQPVTPPHLASGTDSVTTVPSGTQVVAGTVTATGPLTDTQLRASAVPVSPADIRGLVERMMAHAPATGYSLWLDVASSSATTIYLAEAPVGSLSTAAVFRGARLTLDASGNPLGAVMTASAFAWDSRATAPWAA